MRPFLAGGYRNPPLHAICVEFVKNKIFLKKHIDNSQSICYYNMRVVQMR